MSRYQRFLTFKLLFAMFLLSCIPTLLISKELYETLVFSLIIPEASPMLWFRHGFSPYQIMAIITTIGTYNLLFSQLSFNWFRKLYDVGKMEPTLARFDKLITGPGWPPWVFKTKKVIVAVYRFFVPPVNREYFLGAHRLFSKDHHRYLPLIFYGAWPGDIWKGIGYTLTHKLNQFLAFSVESVGNAMKMLIGLGATMCGRIFCPVITDHLADHPWLFAIGIVALSLGSKHLAKKHLRPVVAKYAPQPD